MSTVTRKPYRYTVLRYVHDIASGEFINVGLVVSSAGCEFVGARFKTAFGRVKATFPSVDTKIFRQTMRRMQAAFDAMTSGSPAAMDARAPESIEALVHSVLRADDSSLQWSAPGSGMSHDLPSTLLTLYQRFVTRHDLEVPGERRKDEDVWKQFKMEFEKRHVLAHLQEKVIEVADDSVRFEHAWKNGAWHCYEPVSFDMASGASIKEKAHRWLGQMSSIQESQESFNVYFLVGKPASEGLVRAYEQAVSILCKAPSCEVVEEDQAEEFSKAVAKDVAEHEGQKRL
ncbi:MAG: hypothetical protein JWQ11_21 [Rhizobacter sp.]|nr:hypothetical protein [Rhizobacter sp.]